MNNLIQTAVACLVLLLTACGGGGSDSASTPTAPSGPPTLTWLAGDPLQAGSADGRGTAARFNAPAGVVVDKSGNAYVADYWNHTIRKISKDGTVMTLAGLATMEGSLDGQGSAARFHFPFGVALDSANRLVVADAGTRTIRRVTLAGQVSTVAGTPDRFGYADGPSYAASFNFPMGVCVDPSDTIYVADTYNDALRKITTDGRVSTLAGMAYANTVGPVDGLGSAARFWQPRGAACDAYGNIFVADTISAEIRKVTPAGLVTTLAGQPIQPGALDGAGSYASFNLPLGLAVDGAGNLYVADSENHTVRKVSAAGVVTTLAGVAGVRGFVPGALPGGLDTPQGVALYGNSLYITSGHGVVVIAPLP